VGITVGSRELPGRMACDKRNNNNNNNNNNNTLTLAMSQVYISAPTVHLSI
jgi:hypothetical protein